MILIIQLATNVSGICLHQLLFRGLHHNAVLATTKNLAFFGLGLLNLRACPKNQTFVLFRLIQRPCSHNLGNNCAKETVNKYPGSKNSKYLVKWLRSVLKTEHRASRLALVWKKKVETKLTRFAITLLLLLLLPLQLQRLQVRLTERY